MKQHAGLLHNTATDRWHPILFRESPRPSEHGETHCRHKSVGHHTTGFATEAEATAEIAKHADWSFTGGVWEWNGEGVPAMTPFLPVFTAEYAEQVAP